MIPSPHVLLRLLAVGLFVGLAGWLATEMPAFHEGRSVYPGQAERVLDSMGDDDAAANNTAANTAAATLHFAPKCGDGPILLRSPSRPHLALCVGTRSYPIMVTDYSAGMVYWAADLMRWWHRDQVVRLRWLGLLIGIISLLLTCRVIERFSNPTTATLATLLMAVTPSFVFLNSLLVHYELTPWLFSMAGILWLTPSTRNRQLLASFCFGLAISSSIKALFLLAPLAALFVRLNGLPAAPTRRQAGRLTIAFLLGLWPLLLSMATDDGAGVSAQATRRIGHILAQISLAGLLAETQNLVWFWSDMLMYLDLGTGHAAEASLPALCLVYPSLLYAIYATAQLWIRGRNATKHSLIAAVGGTLMAGYIVVSAVLYTQTPAANYSPLYGVFGAVMAASIVVFATTAQAVLAALFARFSGVFSGFPNPRGTGLHTALVATLSVAAVAAFIFSSVQRGPPSRYLAFSANLHAERELVAYLTDHEESDTPMMTATYNLAGVFPALSLNRVRPGQAHHLLGCKTRQTPPQTPPQTKARSCLVQRLIVLVGASTQPLRLIAPVRAIPLDEPFVKDLANAVQQAALATGRTAKVEFQGGTGGGLKVLNLWRFSPPTATRDDL